jgi:murein DD-endopeptidase MepM/ murein hydrolase activator NlpD
MTMPTEAVAAANGTTTSAAQPLDGDSGDDASIQAYVASDDSAPSDLDRSAAFSTATLTQMAGTIGITNTSSAVFTNNSNCPIQWPFAVGVPISYGFGPRPGEFHEGVDFTPGNGAHIQAIADGTVRIATEQGGGYGVMIIIDHIIDGKLVSTRYGHMQHGSLQVKTGEHVTVGEYIGRTGNTGQSYGAHTHVEVLMNGTTPIDPLPWLRSHNQC